LAIFVFLSDFFLFSAKNDILIENQSKHPKKQKRPIMVVFA